MFDPRDFLTLSNALLNDQFYQSEAVYRTCISRAYYSVFLEIRDLLELSGVVFSRSSEVHQEVVTELRRRGSTDTTFYTVADMLNALRRRRREADYECGIVVTKGGVNDAVKKAKTIQVNSARLLGGRLIRP